MFFIPSTLETIEAFDVNTTEVTEEQHEDGQAYGNLGGSNHQNEKDKNLTGGITKPTRKGNKINVGRKQYQLDRHQQNDQVSPVDEKTKQANRKNNGTQY